MAARNVDHLFNVSERSSNINETRLGKCLMEWLQDHGSWSRLKLFAFIQNDKLELKFTN